VPAEDLERDDQRVLHQVGVHRRMEDLDGAVVRGAGEEGEGRVVCDGSEGLGVVSSVCQRGIRDARWDPRNCLA
jgi:hypothetical protein